MKHYPSISKEVRQDIYIYAFRKIDGSLIRAEWNAKRGFYKFGTKQQLIDDKTPSFGQAVSLIREKYQSALTAIFQSLSCKEAICFFEFYGPSSFAGSHNFQEKMDVILFDVNLYKQGIMEPADFIQHFSHLDIPKVCYQGYVTTELFDQIKQSTLPDIPLEGVVCKGANDKQTKMPIMFKVKTNAWLTKLKQHCKDDTKLFDQLA